MIEIRNLCKTFNGTRAVANLSLRVEPGDAFGFIGPNGAGKTTTIRMLATLLEPDQGDALIEGCSIIEEPELVRAAIGYMPDFYGIYEGIKVWEYLDFFAAAYRRPRRDRRQLIADVLELTDLSGKSENFIETLSKGMRQRLCLAKTLLHDPKILLLDEPASGLDPRARIELKALLRELTHLGKTIFVSSHILPELADICNKVGIIEAGQLVVAGEVEQITQGLWSTRRLNLRLAETDPGAESSHTGQWQQARKILEADPKVFRLQENKNSLHFDYQGDTSAMADLLADLIGRGIRVASFWEDATDLEDVFMKVTKGVVQ